MDQIILSRGEIRSEESLVIFDSSYFKNIDGVEATIEADSKLQDIDIRVKEEYLQTLTEFYQVLPVTQTLRVKTELQCFESIQRYGADLVQLVEDLDGGKFIQQNIESLLRQEEGRQLLTEVKYLVYIWYFEFLV